MVVLPLILTEGTNDCVTLIVIVLEVMGEPVAQLELDVIITFIISPFAHVLLLKVGRFAPALTPFICH